MKRNGSVTLSRDRRLNFALGITAVLLGLAVLYIMLFVNTAYTVQDKWPDEPLTEGISSCPGDIYSVKIEENTAAIFSSNVTVVDITEYIKTCGVPFAATTDFSAPLSAELGDRTVIIAFDAASGQMSVTITRDDK